FILNLANADQAVDAEMNRIFELFVRRYKSYWTAADPRTVAILFELRTASQIKELSLFTNLTQHVFVLRCDQNSSDRIEIDEILTKFDRRMRPGKGGGGRATTTTRLIF